MKHKPLNIQQQSTSILSADRINIFVPLRWAKIQDNLEKQRQHTTAVGEDACSRIGRQGNRSKKLITRFHPTPRYRQCESMYSFFNEAYHISHYITSNDRLLNNKSERI